MSLQEECKLREIAAMSESNAPTVDWSSAVCGSVTVISPQDQGNAHPQTYHLRESAIVLIWATRQGHEITAWVRDVLNNVWVIIHEDE